MMITLNQKTVQKLKIYNKGVGLIPTPFMFPNLKNKS